MSSANEIFEQMITGDEFEPYRAKWCTERTKFSIPSASAFFIGVMLEQGQKADQIRGAGEHFVQNYFPNDSIWYDIAQEPIERLTEICQRGYVREDCEPRGYATRFSFKKFPKWIKDNAQIMIDKYNGDPRKIWNVSKENVEEIYTRFKEFHGIGPDLARMAQFILVRHRGVAGGIESKQYLQIKPDVHIKRVLFRMGLSEGETRKDAIKCVVDANVSSQADLDFVLLQTGRKFCFKSKPNCTICPLTKLCNKISLPNIK